ncbi:MAG TPA: rhodanese-like domain-containing protein [Gammaproteobacteria bacterium]|nr:rhodanese-like domain-containing protein [Gammaproteobacteria bacterium]
MHKIISLLALAGLLLGGTAIAGDDFPGREKYKKVPYIELEDLYKKLNDVVVVDARSKLEFETLRVKTAMNIPVASEDFEAQVVKLRSTTDKPIVFYCNGHTCMKSYIATKKAMAAGVDNVFAFDAGIFDWTKAHPKEAVLLGESPVNLAHLIPKSTFKKRLISPDKFSDLATSDRRKYMTIDVRDKFQRAGIGFYPGIERWASLDQQKKLEKYLKKAIKQNRTLLIYDEVGKQVRWLQYALEKAGVKKYYFMKKGAKGYYKELVALDKQ